MVLAEVSDKIVSTGEVWAVTAVFSAVVGAIAVASRWWAAMLVATTISLLVCLFTLSFLNDPIFGNAVLQENGWSWFVTKIAACLLPIVTLIIVMLCTSRPKGTGFEVVRPGASG